jgi:dolichol-phosphate mannosyltransferase
MRALVLLPLFNEAPTVGRVLDQVHRWAPGHRVLVVDDGSTDGSADVLREYPDLAVLTHAQNEGYGQSLIDGFAYALAHGFDSVVTLDCDEQHEPRQIPQFLAALDGPDGPVDIVSGSRYLDPDAPGDPAPPDRRALNAEITERLRALTGYQITDAFCGFKAYRASALAKLRLTEPSYGMPLQVWIQAAAHRLRIVEIATARIYKNPERRFWGGLDDTDVRRRYYEEVMEREVTRWLGPS